MSEEAIATIAAECANEFSADMDAIRNTEICK